MFVDPSGTVKVTYEGGGINAANGSVNLVAKQEIRIGAGIFAALNVSLVGQAITGGGTGSIGAGGDVNIVGNVGSNVNASANGSINVSGGVAQGASFSAGGIVSGAGAGVGSNAGGGERELELSDLTERAAEAGAAGLDAARKGAGAAGRPAS